MVLYKLCEVGLASQGAEVFEEYVAGCYGKLRRAAPVLVGTYFNCDSWIEGARYEQSGMFIDHDGLGEKVEDGPEYCSKIRGKVKKRNLRNYPSRADHIEKFTPEKLRELAHNATLRVDASTSLNQCYISNRSGLDKHEFRQCIPCGNSGRMK